MISLETQKDKFIYFTSDLHLGAPDFNQSLPREKRFVDWLTSIKPQTQALFILGDLFDFWFEYKKVVPKGFVRVLGKLAEFTDSGIPVYFFVGNHDLWMKDYFQQELNIPVYHKPQEFLLDEKLFFIGHGDGLGPGDKGYKRMKKVFTFPFFQWLFQWLHPDLGVSLGQYMSVKNKIISGDEDIKFLGEENEWLAQYSLKKLREKHRDFFVFGHRHLPLNIKLNEKSTYYNLGDWIQYFTYGKYKKGDFQLLEYKD